MMKLSKRIEEVLEKFDFSLCGGISEKTAGQIKDYIVGGWQRPKEFWED